jgi:hypothetical protein
LSARLGVLRGPRNADDALPPQAASTPHDLAFIGGNDALARRVHGPGPARWIVPGANGLCLSEQTATSFAHACGATDSVGIPPGAASISWIASDGSKGGVDIPAVDEPASP